MIDRIAAIATLLALSPVAGAQEPPPAVTVAIDEDTRATWMLRIARMEGATVDIEEAAAALAATAQSIADAGRVQDVALLSGQARQLQRKVTSAAMAASILAER
jgi:hypothetical protein